MQEQKLYNQAEMLELINNYNQTDRKIIKANFKRLMREFDFEPKDVIALGYSSSNTYAWGTHVNRNIPMFDQALNLAINFGFDVEEFLQEI